MRREGRGVADAADRDAPMPLTHAQTSGKQG